MSERTVSAANELVRVGFHGDTVEAVKDESGNVWVSVRRVCESLEVNVSTQQRKLQGKPWAVGVMMTSTGRDGKSYEQFMLHLDCLPMWLATIEPSKVKEEVREKLAIYQRECAAVLRDHFLGRKAEDCPVTRGELKDLIRSVLAEIVPAAPVGPMIPMPAVPFCSIETRAWEHGWYMVSTSQKRRIREVANRLILEAHGEPPALMYKQQVYFQHQFAILDKAIRIVRAQEEAKEDAGIFREVDALA